MLACNRDCWSAKARCRLAIAIADQQKPNAGLQSRLRVSKGQMLACNRDCGSARAKCWLTIAIADQQEPNAGLQSRLRVSKSQMLAYNRDCWSARAKCWPAIAIAGQQKPDAGLHLGRVAKKSSVWPVKLKAEWLMPGQIQKSKVCINFQNSGLLPSSNCSASRPATPTTRATGSPFRVITIFSCCASLTHASRFVSFKPMTFIRSPQSSCAMACA